jgi:membrane-associated protease RseP (regulator of RpoE activity)
MNFGQSLLGTMLMGNSYSTPPRRFFRFNVAEIAGVSRVQASGWMELQMAFGQMKRTDFAGPEFHNSILNFMGAAGGRLPIGTTFPNHAMLGIENKDVVEGKFHKMQVTSVVPGSPAAKAGIEVGDLVEQVAGRRFKQPDDLLDAAAKAAESSTYDVGIERGGKKMVMKLERAFRPAITETAVATAEPTALPVPGPSMSWLTNSQSLLSSKSKAC